MLLLIVEHSTNRARGTGLKSCQGRFRLDIKKNFLTQMVINHWNSVPREAADSPSLEVFKRHVDTAVMVLVFWWAYRIIES